MFQLRKKLLGPGKKSNKGFLNYIIFYASEQTFSPRACDFLYSRKNQCLILDVSQLLLVCIPAMHCVNRQFRKLHLQLNFGGLSRETYFFNRLANLYIFIVHSAHILCNIRLYNTYNSIYCTAILT